MALVEEGGHVTAVGEDAAVTNNDDRQGDGIGGGDLRGSVHG